MKKPFMVFVIDTANPQGGWGDACRDRGIVQYYATDREAADVGRKAWKTQFPNSGKYQVVNIETGELIGTGGHKTGRAPA